MLLLFGIFAFVLNKRTIKQEFENIKSTLKDDHLLTIMNNLNAIEMPLDKPINKLYFLESLSGSELCMTIEKTGHFFTYSRLHYIATYSEDLSFNVIMALIHKRLDCMTTDEMISLKLLQNNNFTDNQLVVLLLLFRENKVKMHCNFKLLQSLLQRILQLWIISFSNVPMYNEII